jgi:hypothetical protein
MPADEVCLELEDHAVLQYSAIKFFKLGGTRDPHVAAARMAEQFVAQNRGLLALLDVQVKREYDGSDVVLNIHSGSAIGAIPLMSPTSAQPDYGLVVQPRFPWAGIGPMLAEMGWRICPTPLRLPLLHRSERRVPPWVLSSMVLLRLRALLDSLDRRFEIAKELRSSPRGGVDWIQYATRSLPRGKFLSIPCTFADLRDDRLLKGAIRHTVERHLRSLETQREHGAFVHRLIELALDLQRRVQGAACYVPSTMMLSTWLQRPLRTEHFVDGIQAIEWTVEERGLAGLSDLEGIPWTMPMEQFFEAWVESVLQAVVQRAGGELRVGRRRETVHPISWTPSYLGSQKSLIPDLWVEWEDLTLIVDAKYKRHWEELHLSSWAGAESELRERHRNDLLQVLAYANLARTSRVVACLAYPCSPESWASLRDRGRLIHSAEVSVGERSLLLWLTAVPLATEVERVAEPIADALRSVLSRETVSSRRSF